MGTHSIPSTGTLTRRLADGDARHVLTRRLSSGTTTTVGRRRSASARHEERVNVDRAQDFLEERIEHGGFRCDRCAMVWPLPWREQDGFRLCERDYDPIGRIEAKQIIADSQARGGINPLTSLPLAPVAAFDSAPAITAVSPTSITITHGGSAGSISITGVNLSASDTWAGSHASITVTPTINSSTSVTLAVSVPIGTVPAAGDYNIAFNGDTLMPRGIVKVR